MIDYLLRIYDCAQYIILHVCMFTQEGQRTAATVGLRTTATEGRMEILRTKRMPFHPSRSRTA